MIKLHFCNEYKFMNILKFFKRSIKHNKLLNIFQFAKWNMIGLWHSAVAYFFTYFFFDKNLGYDGKVSVKKIETLPELMSK